jgi:hypothetical protein
MKSCYTIRIALSAGLAFACATHALESNLVLSVY